ncbi:MAG: ABC transporter ATP-binding protein [Candidatus Omnitrophica bacterium]|nr:ABC transporter ATP-binding protein [Candidatus Omnitrophota bacterium]MDD5575029.1 ABC transporter ATP-binding protein [Candidatus Omnitrophota bacterium]
MPILKVDIASKSYPANAETLLVFEKIRFEIGRGEFVCLVGPSGCGKTTLLNILAGLDPRYEGEVLFKGRRVDGCDADRLMIFQELGLFPWLTVRENIAFGLKCKKVPAAKRARICSEYLHMVDLARFQDSYIHEISAGMKQRVALARALAMDPEVLLMDEPFSSLDAQARDLLYEELQRIWGITKKTIVFVTHNVREAVCLGDRILVFSAPPVARLKASFSVGLPRPRTIEANGVIDIVKCVFGELKSEIRKTYDHEFHP